MDNPSFHHPISIESPELVYKFQFVPYETAYHSTVGWFIHTGTGNVSGHNASIAYNASSGFDFKPGRAG